MQGLRTVCQQLKVLKRNQYGEEKITLHYCNGDKKYYIKKIYSYSGYLLNILQNIQQASSPHLSKIYEIKYSQSKIECIEEYCSEGNLQEIHQRKRLDTIQIITCFNDIVNGLKNLKDLGYMHRDIKPQNILFDGRNYLISDFETVKSIENDERKIQSQVGTKLFCAPEILMMQNYSSKCDIWSLGCLLYYLMNTSYLELNPQEIIQIYQNGMQISLPQNQYPKEMNDLLSKMLKKEDERISLDQVTIQIKINNSISSGCTTANTSSHSLQNNELTSEQTKELILSKLQNERDLEIQYYLLAILEDILNRRYQEQDVNVGNQRLFILQLYEINNLSLQNQESSLNKYLDINEIKQFFIENGIYQDVINLYDYQKILE